MSGRREWKPGDVVSLRLVDKSASIAMRLGPAAPGWAVLLEGHVVTIYDNQHRGIRHPDIRPLLVIDPEDREQARHAAHEFSMALNDIPYQHDNYADELTKAGRVALLALLGRPKPPEPTGTYSVVRDANGLEWVRLGSGPAAWMHNGSPSNRGTCDYADIDAVEVLSEGVQ